MPSRDGQHGRPGHQAPSCEPIADGFADKDRGKGSLTRGLAIKYNKLTEVIP